MSERSVNIAGSRDLDHQSGLTILDAGIFSLIQDMGRYGHLGKGISIGGPADNHAFAWANYLLGNPMHGAQIEVCYGKFSVRFNSPTRFALTGADLNWRLDNQAISVWQTCTAKPGSLLTAGVARCGLRGYLAVQGGLQLDAELGSCATVMGDRLGGLGEGMPLKSGNWLDYPATEETAVRSTPRQYIPDYNGIVQLRVVPSNQYELFSNQAKDAFFSQEYRLSSNSDRMGYRLEGKPLINIPGNRVSEAIPFGTIQMPKNGLPIILLHDRQTIGGYPTLGNVYAVDIDRLMQLKPGASICFKLGDLKEAQSELVRFRQFFDWQLPKLI